MEPDLSMPVVLVVEDEWLIRAEIVEEFQQAGWAILETSTAEAALALARSGHRIDTLVTDIRLAGDLSGWDLAEALRKGDPNVGVIYASGTFVEKSRMVPGSVFLTKPCNSAELLETGRRLNQCRGPTH